MRLSPPEKRSVSEIPTGETTAIKKVWQSKNKSSIGNGETEPIAQGPKRKRTIAVEGTFIFQHTSFVDEPLLVGRNLRALH